MRDIQKIIFVLSLSIVFAAISYGQTVVFNEPIEVQQMLNKYVEVNRQNPTVKGWRIQIISTDDRRKMESERGRFHALYPHLPTTWKHFAPYYQVRVGAYEDKTRLMSFLQEVKKDFPLASPVVDEIDKTDLLR